MSKYTCTLVIAISMLFSFQAKSDIGTYQKLVTAVQVGNFSIVKEILSRGIDIDKYDYHTNNTTPLIEAAALCRADFIDLLMQSNAKLTRGIVKYGKEFGTTFTYWKTPFTTAIESHCAQEVLLRLVNKDYFTFFEGEIFSVDKLNTVDHLIRHNPKIEVSFIQHLESLGLVIKDNAQLLTAVKANRIDIVRYLLNREVSPNVDGALNYAVYYWNLYQEIATLLLESGADVRSRHPCVESAYAHRDLDAIHCAITANNGGLEWLLSKLPNQKFRVNYVNSTNAFLCQDSSLKSFKFLLETDKVEVTNPKEIFDNLIISSLNNFGTSADLVACENNFPFLRLYLEKYGSKYDVHSVNIDKFYGGKTINPAGYFLKKFGPNAYTSQLVKIGNGAEHVWKYAHTYEQVQWLIGLGYSVPVDQLYTFLKNEYEYIDQELYRLLVDNGARLEDASQFKEIFDNIFFKQDFKFVLSVLRTLPKEEIQKLKINELLSYRLSEIEDKQYKDIAEAFIKEGVDIKGVKLSEYCTRPKLMKWAKDKKATDDNVAVECIDKVSLKNYFKLIDSKLGDLNQVTNCKNAMFMVINYIENSKTYYTEMKKRKQSLRTPLCGRNIIDLSLEKSLAQWTHLHRNMYWLVDEEDWDLKDAKFKASIAYSYRLNHTYGAYLADRGASLSERYVVEDIGLSMIPAHYISNRHGGDILLEMFIKYNVRVDDQAYYLYNHNVRNTTYLPLVLKSTGEDGHAKLLRLISAKLIQKYTYEVDHGRKESLLISDKFPFELVEILKPKSEDLSTFFSDDTVLTHYVKFGDLNAVKKLVGLGANVNQKNLKNESPLDVALRVGNTDIATYLVSVGAVVKENAVRP